MGYKDIGRRYSHHVVQRWLEGGSEPGILRDAAQDLQRILYDAPPPPTLPRDFLPFTGGAIGIGGTGESIEVF